MFTVFKTVLNPEVCLSCSLFLSFRCLPFGTAVIMIKVKRGKGGGINGKIIIIIVMLNSDLASLAGKIFCPEPGDAL